MKKVKCVKLTDAFCDWFTLGKTYQVIHGTYEGVTGSFIVDDDGDINDPWYLPDDLDVMGAIFEEVK